jgi:TolB-like protein
MSIALAALVCTLPRPAAAYQQEIKMLAIKMGDSVSRSGKKTVAAVDFTDLQGNVTELGRFLAEEFSIALAGEAKGFEVVDRTHLKSLLQEHKLAATGIIDPPTARKLGQIAGVELLVTGSITPFGDSVRLSVKLLETATAKMLGAATADIPKTKAVEELLATGVGAAAQPAAASGPARAPGRPQASTWSAEVESFLVVVRGCKRSGEKIVCSGSVTNKGSQRDAFCLSWAGGGTAFDNAGNQSSGSVSTSFGAGRGCQTLEPDIPLNFSLAFAGLPSDATSVTIVVNCYPGGSGPGMHRADVSFRHIPLR